MTAFGYLTSLGTRGISLWLEKAFLRADPNEKEIFTEIRGRKPGNVNKSKNSKEVTESKCRTLIHLWSIVLNGYLDLAVPKISLVYNQKNICFDRYYKDSKANESQKQVNPDKSLHYYPTYSMFSIKNKLRYKNLPVKIL